MHGLLDCKRFEEPRESVALLGAKILVDDAKCLVYSYRALFFVTTIEVIISLYYTIRADIN